MSRTTDSASTHTISSRSSTPAYDTYTTAGSTNSDCTHTTRTHGSDSDVCRAAVASALPAALATVPSDGGGRGRSPSPAADAPPPPRRHGDPATGVAPAALAVPGRLSPGARLTSAGIVDGVAPAPVVRGPCPRTNPSDDDASAMAADAADAARPMDTGGGGRDGARSTGNVAEDNWLSTCRSPTLTSMRRASSVSMTRPWMPDRDRYSTSSGTENLDTPPSAVGWSTTDMPMRGKCTTTCHSARSSSPSSPTPLHGPAAPPPASPHAAPTLPPRAEPARDAAGAVAPSSPAGIAGRCMPPTATSPLRAPRLAREPRVKRVLRLAGAAPSGSASSSDDEDDGSREPSSSQSSGDSP